jgi:hypothetical protein
MKRLLMLSAGLTPARAKDAPRLLAEALASGTADLESIAAIVRWVLEEKEEKVAPALGAAAGDVHGGTVDPRGSAAVADALREVDAPTRQAVIQAWKLFAPAMPECAR